MRAGEGDANGMEKFFALDAGGGLDFVQPGIEGLGSDGAGMSADTAGQLGQNGAGGVGSQDGGVFLIGAGGVGIKAEDKAGLLGELVEMIDGGEKQREQAGEPGLSLCDGLIREKLQGNVRLQFGGGDRCRILLRFRRRPKRKDVGALDAKILLSQLSDALRRGLLEVMAVEPVELVEVEDGRAKG